MHHSKLTSTKPLIHIIEGAGRHQSIDFIHASRHPRQEILEPEVTSVLPARIDDRRRKLFPDPTD
jgi:hypothetical protein